MKDFTSREKFVFEDVMTNFLPLILKYNREVYVRLVNDLFEDVIEMNADETLSFNIDKLVFAKATPDVTFPPIGEPILDEYDNMQILWDEPINLLHQEGFKDELSFVFLNVDKNLLEHRDFNYITDETEVDFAFIGLNEDWATDRLIVWAIWSRYDLKHPNEIIANSEQIYFGIIGNEE